MKNTKARSFVAVMIVVAVASLLLRVVIENLININIRQNESYASVTLKFISAALENYAKDNRGFYPAELSDLTQAKPPYLDKKYIDDISRSSIKGYNYGCTVLEASGYSCYAAPVKCKLSGKAVYTIATGGLLAVEECKKAE